MSDSSTYHVLAVDGGGTRCRLALAEGPTLTTVETGSANVSTDFDGGVREIREGLTRLAARTSRTIDDLTRLPAFVGLAGVTGEAMAGRLRGALPFTRVRILDDRPAALRGALGDADGVIAHCGTGSFYGARAGGQMRFAGGWGPVLGDEASAQWIGCLALGVTLETVDGRLPASPLSQRLLADLGDAPGIVRFAGQARPTDFGALAPLVTDHAAQGDALARRVMQAGADEIARALPDIGWTPDQPICLTGGIGPHYAPYFPAAMQARLTRPAGEPLAGAIALARDLARETAP
ncbi:BadF/BadG/BcrA/BcrD ATPase family protein [Maliponia aquimaris]|uniref:Glucosamine kinase GspK n=1 Tax=Maliponia aquimaris TaxID=1673631 RepID=A0A238KZJ8_9RHOB|nr:BadF/BadG/BcrA/BcrD ATPase family protein [Maliponia aquimaris]SMX48060.1 Glucosamine kinase GspK [Maliponia aquimaris]